jgi:antitoxin (DNA-binding transcriptional repressor) of toxin-antitoxin stability system
VTITRDGKPVITLTPAAPEPLPIDDEFIAWMRKRRELRPSLGGDSVTLVREIRDDER